MTTPLPVKRDSLNRRSRFHRQPTGKRIVLTDRDIEIFRLLWRYRFLRSDRIAAALAPNSPKRLIERLGDLYHETHHLTRPSAQWRQARAEQMPLAYALTKLGMKAFSDAVPAITLPHPVVNFGGATSRKIVQFQHALQISETLFDIEQLVLQSPDKTFMNERQILERASAKLSKSIQQTLLETTIRPSRFMPFQQQIHRTHIRPDGLFAIGHKQDGKTLYRFYALEVERQNPLIRRSVEKPSTLKKLLAYQAVLQSNGYLEQLSLPNLFLIITTATHRQFLKTDELANEVWSEDERRFLLLRPPISSSLSTVEGQSAYLSAEQMWNEHFRGGNVL